MMMLILWIKGIFDFFTSSGYLDTYVHETTLSELVLRSGFWFKELLCASSYFSSDLRESG